MKNEKTLWFVTYSESGPCDPDGFFCPECFKNEIEEAVHFLKGLVSVIEPENSPKYRCDICNRDYRE